MKKVRTITCDHMTLLRTITCDHMTLLLTLSFFFYYMTFYHKNTCTLWISIISDNYFKFNLKAESKFTYKKTIKKTISKLQLSLYNVPLIVMVSVY